MAVVRTIPPITPEDLLDGGSPDDPPVEPPLTPEDLLSGGSADDPIANPPALESEPSAFDEFTEKLSSTIGNAQFQQQATGAVANQLFMNYAGKNGWFEDDWLDEQWEQTTVSTLITELGEDAAALFQGNMDDINLADYFSADAGGNLAATLVTQGLLQELGITGGQDLASQIGTGAASSIINNIALDAFNMLGEGTSIFEFNPGSIIGGFAARQVLHAGSEAEGLGQAIGGSIGSMLLGPMVGSYLGTVFGDSVGETWNYVSSKFDEGIGMKEVWEIGTEIFINMPLDFIQGVFGMDEGPPPRT